MCRSFLLFHVWWERLANTDGPTNTETPNDTETWLIRPDQLIHLIPLPLDAQIYWYGSLKALRDNARLLLLLFTWEKVSSWGCVPLPGTACPLKREHVQLFILLLLTAICFKFEFEGSQMDISHSGFVTLFIRCLSKTCRQYFIGK